jgi:hypothetical protein
MARLNVLDPVSILQVGVMAIVAFFIFRTVANATGSSTLARLVP